MSGAIVRTVCGDVAADQLGRVDAHDHLMIVGGPATVALPDLLLEDEVDAKAEASAFGRAGGGAIVDMMPVGAGRDVLALRRISEASGLHVICVSGFHAPQYYDRLHFVRRAGDDALLALLEEDIEGADGADYWMPHRVPTNIRPGALKIGTDYNCLSSLHARLIGVVAEASRRSGLPVITHTGHGTMGPEQIAHFQAAGVEPERVALSHMDRNPDPGLHRELLQEGAWLIYDGAGRERYHPISHVARVYRRLAEDGLAGRILIGGDNATRPTRISRGGQGVAGVLSAFVPGLARNGCPREALEHSLTNAAWDFLALRPTATRPTSGDDPVSGSH